MLIPETPQSGKKPGRIRVAGYTLLELLIVIGIVSTLSVMAAPSFQDSIKRNARDSGMQDLQSAIAMARSEAISQGRRVSICRSVNPGSCSATTGADWDDGWIIFTDASTAGTLDGTDALLQVHGAGTDQSKITLKSVSNGNMTGDFIQFDNNGFLRNSTTGAWFKFCDHDNEQLTARAILLSNTGRPAFSVDQPDGIHHDLAGANLTCP